VKIIQITSVHGPYDNRIYHKECVSLKEHGHEVYLMACPIKDKPNDLVEILPLAKHESRIKHFFFTSILQVLKIAFKEKADVYHIHDPELLIAGLILRVFGYKVIYDVHENNPASLLSKPYIKRKVVSKFISSAFDKFELFAARFMSGIVTATEDIAVRFAKLNPVVLRNFPIAPDFSKITLPKKEKENDVVIFVGGMTEIRGIKELIIAFEKLDNIDLWLLGKFGSDAFERECRALKGWEKVNYLGVVSPQEIYGYIKLADIGIVTYLPFPNHITALPTKPFEYMAGGLPMLMSNFEFWKEVFGEIGTFVDPADSDQIALQIKNMLQDKIRLKEIAQRSVQLIEDEYSWGKERLRLFDLYQRMK